MSNQCGYCKYSGSTVWIVDGQKVLRSNHDKFCPNNHTLQVHPVLLTEDFLFPKTERARSFTFWNQGRDDGRQGVEPTTDNKTYMLGWLEGECAREEAENGCMYLDE